MFFVSLISVIGLIIIVLAALFLVPFLVTLIPITIIGMFLWSGIHLLAGLAWFIVMGAVSILQTLWQALF